MTEEELERLNGLERMARGDEEYFVPRENYTYRRRQEGATFAQIGRELDVSGTTAKKYYQRRLRKIEWAFKTIKNIADADLKAREERDIRTSHSNKATPVLQLLLPHINQIKELTK